jgi:hypothetical protein
MQSLIMVGVGYMGILVAYHFGMLSAGGSIVKMVILDSSGQDITSCDYDVQVSCWSRRNSS